jgi:RNA polymerase sigma-70 factor (ECF subfamily)
VAPVIPSRQTGALLDHLFRRQAGRMVSHFTRLLGPAHLELAQEVVQESMLRALQTWPSQGVPENPEGWLFRVAHNAAMDAVRRNRLFEEKRAEIERGSFGHSNADDPDLESQFRDDELRMIFLCCHPAIPREASVALSLKTVGGFSGKEIARAFLAAEPAIAQRLVRAKRQIRDSNLTLEMPAPGELKQRLNAVLEVIYLIFNEGYAAHSGQDLVRKDLCEEALRLGLLVADSSIATPRAHALVALMALHASRLETRIDEAGNVVLLDSQDRGRWDRQLMALGFWHFERSASGDELSGYHVQAAIAATHARAANSGETDWVQILELYDQLLALNPSAVVQLNRAVALAKVRGAAEGLASIASLENDPKIRDYYLLLAVRGHFLQELDRRAEAAENFRAALARECSEPERRFLTARLEECERMPANSLQDPEKRP